MQAAAIHSSLMKSITYEKVFTDPELALGTLARKLNVHPNHLSQVINTYELKNFYDFINFHRIEEFKRIVTMTENRNYTLVSLAYDCGFNSKASFNRNFKKVTGLAPKASERENPSGTGADVFFGKTDEAVGQRLVGGAVGNPPRPAVRHLYC